MAMQMPSRIIRESSRTSPTLDQLSGDAERLWWRLTTVADDYGRFEADPRVVTAACFPLRAGQRGWVAFVARWMDELERSGGIERYEIRGRIYGHFVQWEKYQRKPLSKPKFPSPNRGDARPDKPCQDLADPDKPCQDLTYPDKPCQDLSGSVIGVVSREVVSRDARVVSTTFAPDRKNRPAPSAASRDVKTRQEQDNPPPSWAFEGQYFRVSELQCAEWDLAFPAVDVVLTVRAAHAWIDANPSHVKTNWKRFLVNWLKREQDRVRLPRAVRAETAEEVAASLRGTP